MGNISKINANGTEYNVMQSGAVQDISLAYNNEKFGAISINNKGNVAVESLSKHVNIEAVKGIQLKPTTNIIVDTSRRLIAGNGNEAHMEVVYDDKGKEGAPSDTSYGEFKLHARNFDLRCHDHGGIALQPCFCDHPNNPSVLHYENKIKFESSRIKDINTNIGTNDSVQVSDYDDTGGEGLEFGTFNNLHTSLFTKDYRFNKDGYVYAVSRGTPLIESGNTKFDYPTQADDTKDIKVNKQRIDASSVTTDVSLKATWDEIVWVARQYADGQIQGGGGTGGGDATKQWVTDNFAKKPDDISAFLTGLPTPLEHITMSSKGNMQISAKDISTAGKYANLNIEGHGNIKLETDKDVEISSVNNTVISTSKVELYNIATDASGEIIESTSPAMVEAVNGLSTGETSTFYFPTIKISAKAKMSSIDASISISYYNNFDGSVYYDSSLEKVHVPMEYTVFYTDTSATTLYKPTATSAKTDVYYADGTQPENGEIHFVKNEDLNEVFIVEINSSKQAKKEPKPYSTTPGYENVVFENITYVPDPTFKTLPPHIDTAINTVKISDIVELAKHKDALLALLRA